VSRTLKGRAGTPWQAICHTRWDSKLWSHRYSGCCMVTIRPRSVIGCAMIDLLISWLNHWSASILAESGAVAGFLSRCKPFWRTERRTLRPAYGTWRPTYRSVKADFELRSPSKKAYHLWVGVESFRKLPLMSCPSTLRRKVVGGGLRSSDFVPAWSTLFLPFLLHHEYRYIPCKNPYCYLYQLEISAL